MQFLHITPEQQAFCQKTDAQNAGLVQNIAAFGGSALVRELLQRDTPTQKPVLIYVEFTIPTVRAAHICHGYQSV